MINLKNYIEYIQDNPNNYWFRRKIFGWGWTPARWQGWLVTIIVFGYIVYQSIILESQSIEPSGDQVLGLLIKVLISISIFSFIAYKKGEKPKWQWGIPDKNKVK